MKLTPSACMSCVALMFNVSPCSAATWPELDFPDDYTVTVVTDETWYAGALPLRIYELNASSATGFARSAGPLSGSLSSESIELLRWFVDSWLHIGESCLLNGEPLAKTHVDKSLADLEAEAAHKKNQLSCIIDEHITVLQLVPDHIPRATVSLSAPSRVRVNVDPAALAGAIGSHLSGATLLSADQASIGGREATTLAYTIAGDPVFVAGSLSASLQGSRWQIEQPGKSLLSLPESQLLVATRGDERMQIAIQPAAPGSGIVVVIEKEAQ